MIEEPSPKHTHKRGLFNRFLDGIEKYGNMLPDPVMLFVIIAVIILISSTVFPC